MKFKRSQLPMAYAMIESAERMKPRRDGREGVEKFFLWWRAFSQIYTVLAAEHGLTTILVRDGAGEVLSRENGSVRVALVEPVGADQMVSLAVASLPEDARLRLTAHPAVKFFVERTPYWRGKPVAVDAFGQRLNGVIHVANTISDEYPVWSPVDRPAYQRWQEDAGDRAAVDLLAVQLGALLLTVSENISAYSLVFDDAADLKVYDQALPLLEIMAGAFLVCGRS